jgi:hypothetical protein
MKTWFVAALGCVCGWLLVHAGTVAAQEERQAPARPLKFTVKAQAEYTDNRDSAPDGLEESTVDFYLRPRADLLLDWQRTFLDLYYELSLRYREDPSRFQSEDEYWHDLGVQFRHAVSDRLTLRAHERFQITDDPSVQEGGTTLRRDASFTINTLEAGLRFDASTTCNVDVNGMHRIKQYDEDVFDVLDEESLEGRATVYQGLSRTLGVFAEVGGQDFTYENKEVADRDFTSVFGAVGFESLFRNFCRASLRVGLRSFEYGDSTLASDDEPYVAALLKVAGNPSSRLFASAKYGMRDSDVFPFASQTETELHARWELDATERLMLELGATYRIGEYDADTLPSAWRARFGTANQVLQFINNQATRTQGDENRLMAWVKAALKVGESTTIEGRVLVEDVESDVSTSFTRNAVSVGVAQSF